MYNIKTLPYFVRGNELFEAVFLGNLALVKELVNESNINEPFNHSTPITVASAMGNLEMVEYLVKNGATITEELIDSTMEMASMYESVGEMFEFILNLKPDLSNIKETLLLNAVQQYPQGLKLLIDADAPLNIWYGITAIDFAAAVNDIDSLKILLDAFPNALKEIEQRHKEGEVGNVVLKYKENTVKFDNGEPPIFAAVKNGNKEMVQVLLDHGADINFTDKHGQTPFHKAAQELDVNMVELLLRNDANPVKDKDGHDPVYYALKKGEKGVTEVLSKMLEEIKKALNSLDVQDNDKNTEVEVPVVFEDNNGTEEEDLPPAGDTHTQDYPTN